MSTHECSFPEEQEPSGRLILAPCLICGLSAMEAIKQMSTERENALADVRALAVALMECADEYDNAALYKGEYLMKKHGDAKRAESFRVIARAALDLRP